MNTAEDVMCADCGWLGPWDEQYRILEPKDRQGDVSGKRGFHLCANCWDRMVGDALMQVAR